MAQNTGKYDSDSVEEVSDDDWDDNDVEGDDAEMPALE